MKTETQMQKLQVENFADIPKISKRGWNMVLEK
jgi:hypothetical protein